MFPLLLCLALTFAGPFLAAAEEKGNTEQNATTDSGTTGDEIDVQKIKQRYWAFCDAEENQVVQNPLYSRRNRFEFSLFGGKNFADPFVGTELYGVSLGFHLSDLFSLHVTGWNTVSHQAATAPSASTNLPRYYVGAESRWSLFYGELGPFGEHLVHFNTYLTAGLGSVTTNAGSNLAGALGIGEQFHLSPRIAINIDLRLLGYQETIFQRNSGQAVPLGQPIDSRFNLSRFLTFGFSFFLDPVPEEKEGCLPPDYEPPTLTFPSLESPFPKLTPEPEEGAEPPPGPEKSVFEVNGGIQTTSDSISDRSLTLSFRNHRRDPSWAYPGEAKQAWDYGVYTEFHDGENALAAYSGVEAQGMVGRKFSEVVDMNLFLGDHHLENHTSLQTKDLFAATLDTAVNPTKSIYLDLIAKNDFVYPELIQPGGVTDLISAKSFFLNADYSPEDVPWRLLTRSSVRFFSDSNVRKHTDVSLMYGLSTGVPWIWVGLGVEYLSFTIPQVSYWSPQRFLGIGPRLELDIPLVKDFSLGFGGNLTEFQEGDFPWALGYYGSARLRYGSRETTHVDLTYIRILSNHEGGSWFQNSYFLGLGTPLDL